MHPPPSGALILFKGSWSKVNAQDRFKAKKTKRICPDKVSVNAKSQCTRARPVHWFFFVVPKCASIFFLKFQNVHRFFFEVPKCASFFFWSSKKCIDFWVKFLTGASIFGWSSWQVHRFWGEVLDMCIDFLGKFQHVHRFSGKVPACASIFWESSSMCIDFLGKFQHVHRFSGEVPTCASILGGSSSMSIDFLGRFKTCASILRGSSDLCTEILGKIQHVHLYSGKVRDMCIGLMGMFWLSAFLGRFLTHFSDEVPDICLKAKKGASGCPKVFYCLKMDRFWDIPMCRFSGLKLSTCASSFWGGSQYHFRRNPYVCTVCLESFHVKFSTLCANFLVKFPTCAFTFGGSSHKIGIYFLGRFLQHMHRFSGEVTKKSGHLPSTTGHQTLAASSGASWVVPRHQWVRLRWSKCLMCTDPISLTSSRPRWVFQKSVFLRPLSPPWCLSDPSQPPV